MIFDVMDSDLKKALADRLHAWEIVEFLQIPTEDIIEIFEEDIAENLAEIKEFANLIDLEDDGQD